MEKEFDLIKVLESTSKQLEMDSLRIMGRKDGYEDVIKFIKDNNLKIFKTEDDTEDAAKIND